MPTKKPKASILVITLLVLGVILATALSISLVSIQERKASIGSNKSNIAYQTADTGIEKVMSDIITAVRANPDQTLLSASLSGCDIASGDIIASGYDVKLKKQNDIVVSCRDSVVKVSEIASIKSIGTVAGQSQRAIEAAVAAGGHKISCSLPGDGSVYCCSVNDGGSVNCKYETGNAAWVDFNANADQSSWNSTSGKYNISCYMSTSLDPGSVSCCRVDGNGKVVCRYETGNGSTWQKFSPDNDNAWTSLSGEYGITCGWGNNLAGGSGIGLACCRIDNNGSTVCKYRKKSGADWSSFNPSYNPFSF